MNNFKNFMENLWQNYVNVAPMAKEIKDALDKKEGKDLKNDHIALRTLAGSKMGIDVLAKAFEEFGYKKCKHYDFKEKKLDAYHYEQDDNNMTKIFISEIRWKEFSEKAQSVAKLMMDSTDFSSSKELLLSGRQWEANHSVYEELYKESEYLAWFYAFGFVVNHFTIDFNTFSKVF